MKSEPLPDLWPLVPVLVPGPGPWSRSLVPGPGPWTLVPVPGPLVPFPWSPILKKNGVGLTILKNNIGIYIYRILIQAGDRIIRGLLELSQLETWVAGVCSLDQHPISSLS